MTQPITGGVGGGSGGPPSSQSTKNLNKNVLLTVSGKCSEFGPPSEPAQGTAWPGHTDAEAGIALRLPLSNESSFFGKPAAVAVTYQGKAYAGVLPVIDWGPSAWTGRVADITGAGAKQLSLPTNGAFTDSICKVIVCADMATAQTYAQEMGKGGIVNPANSRIQSTSILDPAAKLAQAGVQTAAGALSDIAKAFSFIFSLQFLYVLGGGILFIFALYLVAKQSSAGQSAISAGKKAATFAVE